MPNLLQFQAHNWHPTMQEKHLENAKNHSPKDESVVVRSIIFKNCLQFQGQVLKVCTPHQFLKNMMNEKVIYHHFVQIMCSIIIIHTQNILKCKKKKKKKKNPGWKV